MVCCSRGPYLRKYTLTPLSSLSPPRANANIRFTTECSAFAGCARLGVPRLPRKNCQLPRGRVRPLQGVLPDDHCICRISRRSECDSGPSVNGRFLVRVWHHSQGKPGTVGHELPDGSCA